MKFRLEQLLFVPLFVGLLLAVANAQPTGSNTNPSNVLPTVKFAGLPANPTAGMVYYMTDGLSTNCGDSSCTTWGTAVTGGGGSLKLYIWYNASGWTLVGK